MLIPKKKRIRVAAQYVPANRWITGERAEMPEEDIELASPSNVRGSAKVDELEGTNVWILISHCGRGRASSIQLKRE